MAHHSFLPLLWMSALRLCVGQDGKLASLQRRIHPGIREMMKQADVIALINPNCSSYWALGYGSLRHRASLKQLL